MWARPSTLGDETVDGSDSPTLDRADQPFPFQADRRPRLIQELTVRALVALFVLALNEVVGAERSRPMVRILALVGCLLNGPYFVAWRFAPARRLQAYVRTFADVAFVTAGLYVIGGLAAAPYLAVYAVITIYVGLALSSTGCLVVTATASAAYLAVALLQHTGWLAFSRPPMPNAWVIAVFNVFLLNVIGGLTAILAHAYRESRRQLSGVNKELQRAHDESLRLNAEIQRATRLRVLGEVVAGVTHELRNVLQAIAGQVHVARRKVGDDPDEVRKQLDQIEASWRNAMRIIEATLETARRPAAERVSISLPELARRTVELKSFDLRRDRITIRFDFPPALPRVEAEPSQLQQILLNLITNAQDVLRQTRGTRTLEIAGYGQGDRAVIEVRDNGPGIPEDVLPRLFEPFYTTKEHGTGLGLAISAGIVQELGGDLTADNRPGGGAIFRVSLPAKSS